MKTYIQICDGQPFRARYLEGIGLHWGMRDVTIKTDPIHCALASTAVARAHYRFLKNGMLRENDEWYRQCKWETINTEDVCFHVWEPLTRDISSAHWEAVMKERENDTYPG
jgi:hypothetical protein